MIPEGPPSLFAGLTLTAPQENGEGNTEGEDGHVLADIKAGIWVKYPVLAYMQIRQTMF